MSYHHAAEGRLSASTPPGEKAYSWRNASELFIARLAERAAAIEQALGLTALAWFVLGCLVEKGLLVWVA